MKSSAQTILLLLYLSMGRGLYAQANQNSILSLQGYSGILNTPNAHVQQEGTFNFLYTNQRDTIQKAGNVGIPNWQENYLFSVGVFDFAEIGGRLTDTSSFATSSGIRHLSANLKFSTDPLTAHLRFSPALAVGIQDVGGQTHYFETKYIAGSADPLGWLRLSAGYGVGPDRMKGAFGGVELRAQDWVTLLGDYDANNTNVGARLTTPRLPYIPARLTAIFSTPVQHKQNLVMSVGLIIPLDFKELTHRRAAVSGGPSVQTTLWGVLTGRKARLPTPQPTSSSNQGKPEPPEGPDRRARAVATMTPPTTSSLSSEVKSAPMEVPLAHVIPVVPTPVLGLQGKSVGYESLVALRDRLIRAGFVNVRVGRQANTLVVEYENIRYNHSELDAIGVVAGMISQSTDYDAEQLRLVVKRKGLALLQIETPLLPLRNWLEGGDLTGAPTFTVTQKVESEDGVGFVVGDDNPGHLKPSVMVYPSLVTLAGTEHGVFDYQLSIRPELQLPVWRGATGVARWDLPVAWSGNLDSGQIYASYHTPPQLDRLMFFQALPLAPGLVANMGAGKVLGTTNGVLNELNWIPGGGDNTFNVTQSWGRDTSTGMSRNVLLGSYRLFLARYDLAFAATGGRFWAQDTGSLVSMQRFFGDASVSLYFKDTVTPNDSKHWLQAGIQFEFPLTPRRDMKARSIQIRGDEDWIYSQETGVISSGSQNTNYIEPDLAVVPAPTQDLDLYFYDRGRLNADYIHSHMERIRDSWRFFRDNP